jgi:hypothetical protein
VDLVGKGKGEILLAHTVGSTAPRKVSSALATYLRRHLRRIAVEGGIAMRLQNWLYTVPLRLRSLLVRCRQHEDLEEELRDHIARQTEENQGCLYLTVTEACSSSMPSSSLYSDSSVLGTNELPRWADHTAYTSFGTPALMGSLKAN